MSKNSAVINIGAGDAQRRKPSPATNLGSCMDFFAHLGASSPATAILIVFQGAITNSGGKPSTLVGLNYSPVVPDAPKPQMQQHQPPNKTTFKPLSDILMIQIDDEHGLVSNDADITRLSIKNFVEKYKMRKFALTDTPDEG
ncbi:hypothetical protein TWF694_006863 [Orbilia ellipsospora]|uniref:Uncharacterized protein n=1 Tax=Orbilia ellipsospora TaxID=2528407 RepID=A0AAV9XMC3_9PEZI